MTNPFKVGDILYRYYDNWDKPEPRLTEWKITKLTKCGVWIVEKDTIPFDSDFNYEVWHDKPKWMGWGSYRQFAHKTKKEALSAWKKRKIKHFQHVKADYHHLLAIVNKYDLCAEETAEFKPLDLIAEGGC